MIHFKYIWEIIKLSPCTEANPHGCDLQGCISAGQKSSALVITALSVAFAIV